ncbi:MAG TPA: thiamine biosynthesis protein ApbE [Clostridiales bacterium UBA8960]|jgi:thiamine biosynthesis lipoprotein|nr:thiamine biosynthesis protein ApbE [Clostridiales bacterium UBA8960]
MKFKSAIIVFLGIALVISGCSKDPNEMTTQETTEQNTSSALTESNTGEKHQYVRSQSTIKNDSRTQSIITSQSSFQIGTYITLSIYADHEVPNEVFDDLFDLIDHYEYMISKSITTSEVSEVNENAGVKPVKVSSEIIEQLKIGYKYSNDSNGLFDLSIGSLVDLWGIGTKEAHLPEESEIKKSMATVDYKKIIVDDQNQTVFLEESGMVLDLGAIAKGYIADRVKDMILEKGYTSAIVNLGGNVLTVGNKPNSDSWSIGVRDPREDSTTEMGILRLEDNSIVSSGVYERYFVEGDIRFHHIINPKTGYPEQNDMMSISIVSEKSVDGDAFSTTVFLMGLERGLEYIESLENVDAVFIMSDLSVYVTSGIKEKFILVNKDYKLMN